MKKRVNYGFDRRQKEQSRQRKQDEKRQRKLDARNAEAESPAPDTATAAGSPSDTPPIRDTR